VRPVFECAQCGHCCHGVATVSLTPEEQTRVAEFLGLTKEELFQKYLIYNGNRVEMKIVDGHCIFYGKDNLCKIHPVKPFHCRRWPLHPSILNDENAWLAIKADCPGFRKDATYEEVVTLICSRSFLNVTCPFDLLVEQYLDTVLKSRLNLEIGLNGGILDKFSVQDFERVNDILKKNDLKVTIHGPFTDLPLGSVNSSIRKAVINTLKKAIDITRIFGSKTMVIHTGFDPKHHGEYEKAWGERAKESLFELIDHANQKAPNVKLLVENTFEYDPRLHEDIFATFAQEAVGFCFDLAHQVVFSKCSMDEWLRSCGDRLMELHLHDNHGKSDEHLAVGRGRLDFDSLFKWLKEHKKLPILTIEAHNEDAVMPAIRAVSNLLKKYLNTSLK